MSIKKIEYLYFMKALVDDTVTKAFGISEVGSIAKTEKRLREYFVKKWVIASKKIVKLGKPGTTPKQIRRATEAALKIWKEDVQKIFLVELDYIYKLARIAGHKKVTGKARGSLQYDTEELKILKAVRIPKTTLEGIDFNLIDEAAVKAIQDQQLFWLGEFVDGFSEEIEEVARRVMLEAGEDSIRAGALLRERLESSFGDIKIPAGFTGPAIKYFEGLTANAATVARVHGQLQSFLVADASAFMIVNPMDERTCPRCSLLDGLQFPIERGVEMMEAEQEADTIDKVKAAHPWFSESRFKQIRNASSDKTLAKDLADAGIVLPPFHFRCRCTIDIV